MPPPPTVIITETLDDTCAAWLEKHARVVWCRHDDSARFAALLPEADALIVRTYTQVNTALLDQAPRLKVVGRAGVGLDNIDLDACRARQIPVVYTPDANTQAVVEYVFALMLDALRPRPRLAGADDERFFELRQSAVGRQLEERTVGILGFGRIGKRIGQVARSIGMNVLANDLLPEVQLRQSIHRDFDDYAFEFVSKSELYRRSHVLTIHTDGRPENKHLINAAALEQLRDDCVLINAARGMLVDSAALADWAKAHPAARALCDVHDPEPPGPDCPLWGIENVELLPHLASRTHAALRNMSWVVKDVVAVLNGEKPTSRA